MTALHDYQKKFLDTICSETTLNDLPPTLQIYRNATHIIRMNALKQIFPCCEKLVGADYFSQLTRDFVEKHHSTDVAIDQQGKEFLLFLYQNTVLQQVPYFADMAQLEWTWHDVFHRQATLETQGDTMGAYTSLLRTAVNAQFLQSVFPLDQIWAMCQENYRGDQTIQPSEQCRLMIFQQSDQMHLLSLSTIELRVVEMLETPLSFLNLQDKYKIAYNESLTLDVVENLLRRRALYKAVYQGNRS